MLSRAAIERKGGDLTQTHSELAEEFDTEANFPFTADMFTQGSAKIVGWKCNKEGHKWTSKVYHRTQEGKSCPICNSLAILNPSLAAQLDNEKNYPLTAYNVRLGSNKKVGWICPDHSTHKWFARIKQRAEKNGTGCPTCSRHQVLIGVNDLNKTHHELSLEWDWEENDKLEPKVSPYTVTSGSHKKVGWICSKGHKYPARIGHRTFMKSGCPTCFLAQSTSNVEQLFFTEAAKFMTSVKTRLDAIIIQPDGARSLAVDVIGERNGRKVALEYDGARWHSFPDSEQKDLRKTRALLNQRFLVIRIRERCHKKILGNLPLSNPNLLQLPFEWSLDPEKARKTLSKIMRWVDAHDVHSSQDVHIPARNCANSLTV